MIGLMGPRKAKDTMLAGQAIYVAPHSSWEREINKEMEGKMQDREDTR